MHSNHKFLPSTCVALRAASASDLPFLALIHRASYSKKHFTALLSAKTLERYYGLFLDGNATTFIAINGSDILGFIVYGSDLDARIKIFKKIAAWDIFLTSLRNPVITSQKLFNYLLNIFIDKKNNRPANFLLLSIAVKYPGSGVGSILLNHLIGEAQKRGQSVIGLYVNAYNTNAINAYFAAGFVIKNHKRNQFYMEKNLEQ